jgi:biotin carboxyl carrier protein
VYYVVSVNGQRHAVTVESDHVLVDGQRIAASLAQVGGTPIWLLGVGDAISRVVVRRRSGRGEYTLWVDGFAYQVEAFDERRRAILDLSAASTERTGPAPLVAPMPGLVVRVNVNPGDEVRPGQGLVVMEAMKMENELRASAAGRVRAVFVAPGEAVEKGAKLVELE